MTAALRLGTRGSALALAQSQQFADSLTAATGRAGRTGARSSPPVTARANPWPGSGVGVFVSALRDALIAGEIDFAVHSYKDLPTAGDARLHIAAVPVREDPRDALISRDGRTLAELPPGSRIGTGALRRIAQLHALGLQLEVTPIRGNVDTRLARVRGPEADLDAIVLARAGLSRLGRARRDHRDARPDADAAGPRPGRAGRRVPGRRLRDWSSCSRCSTTRRPEPRSPRNGR